MELMKLPYDLSVCKLASMEEFDFCKDFFFLGKTDEEISLVCRTQEVPDRVTDREDGWKAFRIQGILDFSLVGILSRLTGILADNGIGIFAISTYNTDYVLVKKEHFEQAGKLLKDAGYIVCS